ncbi:MAG: hypothetical protein NTW55_01925 [Planctomycetota bacterium]|nr:hypothetical protein [Planctomycetota bacterium]
MIISHIITTLLSIGALALTPQQRWHATGQLESNGSAMTHRPFIICALLTIIILTGSLLLINMFRTRRERKAANELFLKYAEKKGLSARELQIIVAVAAKAGIRQKDDVFTMDDAFDRGVTVIIEESIGRGQGPEETRQLKTELSFLREKLGFQNQFVPSVAGTAAKPKKFSSRQIPAGKSIHITRRMNRVSDEIEAAVIENTEMELTIKLVTPLRINFGEVWRVRYYFGASVWEFDTSVVSYDGDVLVLNHSDNVRFVNRRRFLRVPVSKPGFIARFPFEKTHQVKDESSEEVSTAEQNLSNRIGSFLKPPEFVSAVVTELAGPGLRIEEPMEVKMGDRVLVVFELDKGDTQNQALHGKKKPSKIVEDIGEVRHVKTIEKGFSIAVELTGLSDAEIDELVCVTNAVSVKTSAQSGDDSDLANGMKNAPEPVAAAKEV